jgi:hypothetical protein
MTVFGIPAPDVSTSVAVSVAGVLADIAFVELVRLSRVALAVPTTV